MTRVVVLGPNLLDQTSGSFHVHAEGCADINRSKAYRSREFAEDKRNAIDFSSELEVSEYINADFIDEGSMTAEDGLGDINFFPCVKFETEKESVVDTRTVTTFRKITFEIFKDGLFFDMEVFATKENFADALSEIFAMRNSRNIAY